MVIRPEKHGRITNPSYTKLPRLFLRGRSAGWVPWQDARSRSKRLPTCLTWHAIGLATRTRVPLGHPRVAPAPRSNHRGRPGHRVSGRGRSALGGSVPLHRFPGTPQVNESRLRDAGVSAWVAWKTPYSVRLPKHITQPSNRWCMTSYEIAANSFAWVCGVRRGRLWAWGSPRDNLAEGSMGERVRQLRLHFSVINLSARGFLSSRFTGRRPRQGLGHFLLPGFRVAHHMGNVAPIRSRLVRISDGVEIHVDRRANRVVGQIVARNSASLAQNARAVFHAELRAIASRISSRSAGHGSQASASNASPRRPSLGRRGRLVAD